MRISFMVGEANDLAKAIQDLTSLGLKVKVEDIDLQTYVVYNSLDEIVAETCTMTVDGANKTLVHIVNGDVYNMIRAKFADGVEVKSCEECSEYSEYLNNFTYCSKCDVHYCIDCYEGQCRFCESLVNIITARN